MFDDKKEFILIKKKILTLSKEIIDCINNSNNSKYFSVPQVLFQVSLI